MRPLVLLLALSFTCFAQSWGPSYYTGAGVTYDYYGKSGFAATSIFAAKFRDNPAIYSFTTLEMTRDKATLRTGAAYMFAHSGYWSLIALGDAGLATGSGPTLGSFSGGGFLAYDIGAQLSKNAQHFYIGLGGRLLNITSQTVQPVFEITFGKGF